MLFPHFDKTSARRTQEKHPQKDKRSPMHEVQKEVCAEKQFGQTCSRGPLWDQCATTTIDINGPHQHVLMGGWMPPTWNIQTKENMKKQKTKITLAPPPHRVYSF